MKTANTCISDDRRGYASSDGGGTVRRCGCFVCGIDLQWRSRKKSKHGRGLDDQPVYVETKSGIGRPTRDTGHARGTACEPTVPRLPARSGTEKQRRRLAKTSAAPCNLRAGFPRTELDPLPLLRKDRSPGERRRRTGSGRVGQPEPETAVSLSHYYRRHEHRARNHSRAMRQVADWIENTGMVDTGVTKDTEVGRRWKNSRRHIHEHRHYHYHYHRTVSGMV